MDELFQQLENRIRSLTQKCHLLEQANLSLKQSKSLALREKEILLAKNKAAISQIEKMVMRLKSIENTNDYESD